MTTTLEDAAKATGEPDSATFEGRLETPEEERKRYQKDHKELIASGDERQAMYCLGQWAHFEWRAGNHVKAAALVAEANALAKKLPDCSKLPARRLHTLASWQMEAGLTTEARESLCAALAESKALGLSSAGHSADLMMDISDISDTLEGAHNPLLDLLAFIQQINKLHKSSASGTRPPQMSVAARVIKRAPVQLLELQHPDTGNEAVTMMDVLLQILKPRLTPEQRAWHWVKLARLFQSVQKRECAVQAARRVLDIVATASDPTAAPCEAQEVAVEEARGSEGDAEDEEREDRAEDESSDEEEEDEGEDDHDLDEAEEQAHTCIGLYLIDIGEYTEAVLHHERAVAVAQRRGAFDFQSNALSNLGYAWAKQEDWDKALPLYHEALRVANEHCPDNKRLLGGPLNNLGTALRLLGRVEESTAMYLEALQVVQTHDPDNLRLRAAITGGLSGNRLLEGRTDEVLNGYNEALALARASGSKLSEALDLGSLGCVYRMSGKYEEGRTLLREAIEMLHALGSPHAREMEVELAGLEEDARATDEQRPKKTSKTAS